MTLKNYHKRWENGCNAMIAQWIKDGAPIPLFSEPLPSTERNLPTTYQQKQFIEEEILKLKTAKVIMEVESPPNNISPIGVVPKKNGKLRMIVDLRTVNQYVRTPKFTMEDIRSVKNIIRSKDFMTSIDLKDGFHHIPIRKEHQKYLGMTWNGRFYTWTHLPFGLSASPFIFCKTLRETTQILRTMGIRLNCYMDDLLILGTSKEECLRATRATMEVLEYFGWRINLEKSHLEPTQQIDYLGFTLNTESFPTISIQKAKRTSIRKEVSRLIKQDLVTARKLARLLGLLIANAPAIEPTKIMTRNLFFCLRSKTSWADLIYLDPDAKEELIWWRQNIKNWSSTNIAPSLPTITLSTDASKTGWGASLETRVMVSGFFPLTTQNRSSNYRELMAVLLSTQRLQERLKGRNIQLFTDNFTTLTYINGQGGPHKHLNLLAKATFWKIKELGSTMRAYFIPGKLNIIPDFLSRLNPKQEWQLHPTMFRKLDEMWGPHTIDRFASATNHLLPRYNSRFSDPEAEATDALQQDWRNEKNWINPPFRLIGKILKHIQLQRAEATIILPLWKNQPWFPLLQKMTLATTRIPQWAILPAAENAEPLRNTKWKIFAFMISGKDTQEIGILRPGFSSTQH